MIRALSFVFTFFLLVQLIQSVDFTVNNFSPASVVTQKGTQTGNVANLAASSASSTAFFDMNSPSSGKYRGLMTFDTSTLDLTDNQITQIQLKLSFKAATTASVGSPFLIKAKTSSGAMVRVGALRMKKALQTRTFTLSSTATTSLSNYLLSSGTKSTFLFASKAKGKSLALDTAELMITTQATSNSSSSFFAPTPGTTWQWQLQGQINTSFDVDMYDIDLFDTPQETIDSLLSRGIAVVCYFSTQYENWRPDNKSFTADVLGNNLDNWAGERWVDIRTTTVKNIMTARMDLAVQKKCSGIEPDNVDEYTNNNGLGITAEDQLTFNKFLAQEAHARSLSIALKNDVNQLNELYEDFDFAINEQCFQYKECGNYSSTFIAANKAVFGVEYKLDPSAFCPEANAMGFSWLKKKLSLKAWVEFCSDYANYSSW